LTLKALLGTGLAALLLLAGCEATQQAAAPPPATRFMPPQTVALLRPSDAGSQLYVNPNVDFRRYTRVLLEPVQLWFASNNTQLSAEQRQLIADTLYGALREELGRDFRLVDRPGPGTLRISTAVTEVREGGNPVLSTVSTFVPVTRLAREGANLMTGSDPLVGGAAGEMRIVDSESGVLLAAAIDSRDATAGARVRTSRWDDVQAVTRFWAAQTGYRLCRLQGRATCRTPA
jgi:hypothetical protein